MVQGDAVSFAPHAATSEKVAIKEAIRTRIAFKILAGGGVFLDLCRRRHSIYFTRSMSSRFGMLIVGCAERERMKGLRNGDLAEYADQALRFACEESAVNHATLISLSLVLGAATSCGGKIAPVVEELPFAPDARTAGYGAIGGMRVTLVDTSVTDRKRTMVIQLTGLEGSYDVASGGARVTFKEEDAWRSTRTFYGHAGKVIVDASSLPPKRWSFGTVRVHVDALVEDPNDDEHVLHIVGDYDADVTMVG
jgi:hypothetical protein